MNATKKLSDYKIAIVEDEPSIRSLYETKFTYAGFTVQTAADGGQGYELVKAFQPDLLLLDLRMPGMNGDEMLTKVRAQAWGGNVRVIILTNISRDEAPAVLRLLHVDRYIVKAHHTPSQILGVAQEVLHVR